MYHKICLESFDKKLIIPKDKGSIVTDKFIISKDIILVKNCVKANENILLSKPISEFNQFCMNFNINANAKVSYSNLKEEVVYKNSQIIVGQFTNSSVQMALSKTSNITNIALFLSNNFLEKYLPKFSHLKSSQILKIVKSNPKILSLSKEIYTANTHDSLENIYMQGKVFEIISLGLRYLSPSCSKENKIKFSTYDTNALYQAKEILEKSYQNPPSIIELSKLVRLNEFKLKFGYKQLFGQTPYKTVLDQKMFVAKELLGQEDFNITRVAKEVGYKNIQSFTLAFVKYFGFKPKSIKR